MTKDNAKDFLPLVQALADGRTIQEHDTEGRWHDLDDTDFVREACDYRIKPEQRRLWVCFYEDGSCAAGFGSMGEAASYSATHTMDFAEFVEVLK